MVDEGGLLCGFFLLPQDQLAGSAVYCTSSRSGEEEGAHCVCYCELIFFFFCLCLWPCPLGVIIGRPRPEVTWWLDERLLDQTFVATSESVVQNVLVIGQLERRHLHANLRCQASNAAAITGYNSSSSSSSMAPASLHVLRHHQQQQQQQHYQLHTLVSSVQLDLNRKWS